ncbi:hypothetical protein BG011_008606 [Mortierella polycephala]|uniref:Protein YAE1 n=1 Tax=Mortierella polycephala TaxID=41804 RepID=A0A9P6PQT9_9FUNG|nr:hypothetical protein BG011_008606 [Mortierella polycephala]
MTDQDHTKDRSPVNAWKEEEEEDGDDIWDEGDNVSYDRTIAEKEWSRLHETFGNTGYREGIEEGKEETLQQGFNQGWSEGVQYGHELGKLRGLISPLLEYLRSSASPAIASLSNSQDREAWIKRAADLVKELTELDIAKVFDKAYFDDGRGPSSKSNETKSTSTGEADGGTGCCGGSSSSKESCCKKDNPSSPVNDGDASGLSHPSQGCCSSKKGDSCQSKDSAESMKCGSLEKKTKDEEWSSRPDRVINTYRTRVHDLLKEANMESLMPETK